MPSHFQELRSILEQTTPPAPQSSLPTSAVGPQGEEAAGHRILPVTSPRPESLSVEAALLRSESPSLPSVRRGLAPVMAVVPAALLLGLGLATRDMPPAQPFAGLENPTPSANGATVSGESLAVEGDHAILYASQTVVVQPRPALKTVVWKAPLQPAIDVVGRAPVSGQVTRVWVRPGENVSVGDRVMRLASSSTSYAPAPVVSPASREAEQQQVQAAKAQEALQQRMNLAQQRFERAQDRVARAQQRVENARKLIAQLQQGLDTEDEFGDEAKNVPASTPKTEAAQREVDAAEAAASRAEDALEAAQSKAAAAAREIDKAENDASLKTKKARELRETREREQSQIKAPKAAPKADVKSDGTTGATPAPVATTAVKETVSASDVASAAAAASTATNRAILMREQAEKHDSAVESARRDAMQARERLATARRKLRELGEAAALSTPSSRRRSARKLPSIDEAVRIVREATSESAAANREARRLRDEVDSYAAKARQTQQLIDSSSSELQESQQQAMDRIISQNLSVVRAPSSGRVVWVRDVGQSVDSGEPLISVGKAGVLRAKFRDYSGLWRRLKEDAPLTALIALPQEASNAATGRDEQGGAQASTVATGAPATPSAPSSLLTPVEARVEEIESPERPGEPAIIRAVVRTSISARVAPRADGSSASVTQIRLRPGMIVQCALPVADTPASQRKTILLPLSAILPIAAPVSTGAAQPGAATTNMATTATAVATEPAEGEVRSQDASTSAISSPSANAVGADSAAPRDAAVDAATGEVPPSTEPAVDNHGVVAVLVPEGDVGYRVEWRTVELGQSNGVQQEVLSGLQTGERVALPSDQLRAFTLSRGASALVQLRDEAGL